MEIEFSAGYVEYRMRLKVTMGTQTNYGDPLIVWSGQWRRLGPQQIEIKYDKDISGTNVKAGDSVVWNASIQGNEVRFGETVYIRK